MGRLIHFYWRQTYNPNCISWLDHMSHFRNQITWKGITDLMPAFTLVLSWIHHSSWKKARWQSRKQRSRYTIEEICTNLNQFRHVFCWPHRNLLGFVMPLFKLLLTSFRILPKFGKATEEETCWQQTLPALLESHFHWPEEGKCCLQFPCSMLITSFTLSFQPHRAKLLNYGSSEL